MMTTGCAGGSHAGGSHAGGSYAALGVSDDERFRLSTYGVNDTDGVNDTLICHG